MLLSVRFQLSLRGLKCTSYRCLMLHFRLSVLPNIFCNVIIFHVVYAPKEKTDIKDSSAAGDTFETHTNTKMFPWFIPALGYHKYYIIYCGLCLPLDFSVGALLYLNKSQSDGLSFAQSICCEGPVAHPHR